MCNTLQSLLIELGLSRANSFETYYPRVRDRDDFLRTLRRKMKDDGLLIVEVPHARDFLLETLDSEAFKAFTFWSEHLILHTRKSLMVFLAAAGFRNVNIAGYQRYSIANHLYWLARKSPNGHNIWSFLTSQALNDSYHETLLRLDQTDTLIAYANA